MSDTSSTPPARRKSTSKGATAITPTGATSEASALEIAADVEGAVTESLADWREQASEFAGQAKTKATEAAGTAKVKAREAATTAKNTTGDALHGLSKLIAETAGTVDSKLGPQYGDYARRAAETVAGAADSLDAKDIDQLTEEARNFVRKSPAVAIGAAAVVGFVLMRMMRGSSSSDSSKNS